MKHLHIITGQTATGKTAKALEYALQINGEVVNFDSRQIYKHLDIVTGKDFQKKNFAVVKQNGIQDIGYYTLGVHDIPVKLWLYDIVDPKQPFSSHDFQNLCMVVLADIWNRGKVPVLVGGTYMYLYFLLYGSSEMQPPNWELRKQMETFTVQELQELVQQKNSEAFQEMNESDRKNPHRLIRFLERTSFENTMKFETILYKKMQLSKEELTISIEGFRHKNRDDIKPLIKKRVLSRIEAGAVTETEHLLQNGYLPEDPGMKSIGYNQITQFINKKITFEEMAEEWVTKEYQYAKRQITFMKRDPNIQWQEV